MRTLVVAVLVGLTAAAPAQAGWKLDRATAIAETVWAESGIHTICPDGLQIALASPDPDEPFAGGWSWEYDCTIHLNRNALNHEFRWFEPLCTTVLHEAGHVVRYRDPLTGDPHASNPSSVMAAHGIYVQQQWIDKRKRLHTRWIGTDARCRKRGRPYLERHDRLTTHSPVNSQHGR